MVEDPVRDEHAHAGHSALRQMTICPLCHGEEWGQRWDFNRLMENHDIDYIRATLPNVGGITEMLKVAALCETHACGNRPAFHGAGCDCRAGQLPFDVLGPGAVRVQLRRPAHPVPARVPGFQARAGSTPTTVPAWASLWM